MKLHLPKQLFTALLAAITLVAPSAWGTTGYIDEPTKSGNFWADDYTFVFVWDGSDSDVIGSVLTFYRGNATDNNYGYNAWTLDTSDGNGVLTVGRGRAVNTVDDATGIDENTTFTYASGSDDSRKFTIEAGVVYRVSVTGGNQAMTPTITKVADADTTTASSYNGNMNGDAATTVASNSNYMVATDSIIWKSAPSSESNWTTVQGTDVSEVEDKNLIFDANRNVIKEVDISDSTRVASIKVYGDYTFGGNGSLTVTGNLNIAAGASATFNVATTLSGTADVYGTLAVTTTSGLGTVNVKNGGILDLTEVEEYGDHLTRQKWEDIENNSNLTTQEGGFIKVKTDHDGSNGGELNLDADGIKLTKNYLTSRVDVHAGGNTDGRALTIGSGATLKSTGEIKMVSNGKLVVDGGNLIAEYLTMGHTADSSHPGFLEMNSGSIKTGYIQLINDNENTISISGGALEFTTSSAIMRNDNTSTTISIGGTAENPVTLKASQVAWTLDGSGLSTAPTIENVTIDSANTHGITLKNVSLSGNIVNNAKLALGSGVTVAANDSATVTGDKVQILSTLASSGTLALNTSSIYVSEIMQGFVKKGGNSGYSLSGNAIDANGVNGFKVNSGATYYLSEDTKVTTGCTKVWLNDTTSYDLVSDDSGLHFTVAGVVRSDAYYINSDNVTVDSNVQDLATSYVLQGGNMQLTEGSVNTSTITYTSGSITLSDGAELVLDGVPAGMTVNSLLSSILSSTSAGNVKIARSGLDTYDGVEGSGHADYSLNSAFAGTLELAAGVGFTLGNGNKDSYSENAVITLGNLSGMKLNDGSTLYYNASGVTTIKNLQVVDAASATIHFKDSKSANAVKFAEKTQLDGDLTVSTTHDGGITFTNLVGDGSLTGSSGSGTFKTTISSLQYTEGGETSTFTGSLSFSGDSNVVEVSTGTGADISSIVSLCATNVNSLTFNVQTDTTVGTVSLSGSNNSINISGGESLSVGTGTVTNGSFSTGSVKVASKSEDTPASLSHVKMTGSGFSAATSANGSKGSISNAQLTQLQTDATFTIQDMTLTNTTIIAATPTTQVNFIDVTVTGATVLKNLQAAMIDPSVTPGGSETDTKGSFTATTSLLSGITLANKDVDGSTLVVDLGDLSCAAAMGPGKYNLSITLSGFHMQKYDTPGLLFAADSWLGKLLSAQRATDYVSGAVETPASVSEGGGVSVSYADGGANVGTVITITGLNVPEPATSTLSLLALAALAARRRRK